MLKKKMRNKYHEPVLLQEAIKGLHIQSGGTYVDATYGGGGHTHVILDQLEDGHVFVFDQDKSVGPQLPDDDRVEFINHNFRFIKRFLRYFNAIPVDGILADLGVASFQIDTPGKGFSTRYDGPLDMRMDEDLMVKASDVVNKVEKAGLIKIFSRYGEVRNSKTLANRIVEARKQQPIETVSQFKEAIEPVTPKKNPNRYLAQVFQALRIEVNDELQALREFLQQSGEILCQGGRLVVISYHSLEDRLVKRFMKDGVFETQTETPASPFVHEVSTEKPMKPLTKKPITPSAGEIKTNRRARSAKLRIAEKKLNNESI